MSSSRVVLVSDLLSAAGPSRAVLVLDAAVTPSSSPPPQATSPSAPSASSESSSAGLFIRVLLIALLLCVQARDLLPRRLRFGCFSPVSDRQQLVASRA